VDQNETAYLGWILSQHSDKDFVQRILKPAESPILEDRDGKGYATHKMAYEYNNGKYYAFPTIMREGKGLRDYGKEAFREALNRGEYIEFNTPGEADWFSKNYKKIWEMK
jgi:hypothetical protein